MSAGNRFGAVDRALDRRKAETRELADLRTRIDSLEADRATLERMQTLDRDGRYLQADGLYRIGNDPRFEPAVQANEDRRHAPWWKVSGAILGGGAALAVAASAIPGVAPWLPGLLGGIAFYGAIVGPSNWRTVEDGQRVRRVDRVLTEIVDREIARDGESLKAARARVEELEASLARTDQDHIREELEGAEAPGTIAETETTVEIGGVQLPRGRRTT